MSESQTDDYGTLARFYDRLLEPLNRPLRELVIRMVPVSDSTTVLDVGCGTGGLVEAFAARGATVTGIDRSPAMLAVARERLGVVADLHEGDATQLPFEDNSFDLVTASLFLHELQPKMRSEAVDEMARVTKPDGQILIIDYRVGSLKPKGRMMRGVSMVAERLAGRTHHRNWKTYLQSGGIPPVLADLGLEVQREKAVAGGNLSLWTIGTAPV